MNVPLPEAGNLIDFEHTLHSSPLNLSALNTVAIVQSETRLLELVGTQLSDGVGMNVVDDQFLFITTCTVLRLCIWPENAC